MNHRINKKSLIFLFLILASAFNVFAAPPSQAFGELTLVYPKVEVTKLGEDKKIHLHGFDSTNTLLNTSDYDCTIHVYDMQNNHLIEELMGNDSNTIEKIFVLNTSIISNTGAYSYNIWCDETGAGSENGVLSESFIVTKTGVLSGVGDIPLIIGIFTVVLALLLMASQLNNKHFLFKLLTQFFALYFMFLIPSVTLNNLSGAALTFYTLYNKFIWVFWIYLFIYLIYELLNYMGKLANIKRGLTNITQKYKK